MFAVRSLREDRCEGKNSKAFTHSALIANDLRRVGEGVKAKNENRLWRAYVRARRANSVTVFCVRRPSCVKWGRGEQKWPVCARLFPCFAQSVRVVLLAVEGASGACSFSLHGVQRCGIDRGGAGGPPTLPRRVLRIQPIHRRATTVTRAKQSMLREVMPNISFISRPGGRLSK